MSNVVRVVGLGMGPQDLTPRQREVIEAAQVLAGGQRLLGQFSGHAGQRLPLRADLASWLDQVALAASEREVVVLASGDPLFFGVGRSLLERLGPEGVEILPNLTALQAAFALLKEPWQDARVVSLHGDRDWRALWWALPGAERVAVLSDPRNTPGSVARALLERDQIHWEMLVLENLGGPDQRVAAYSLEQAATGDFAPLNLVVLKRRGWPRPVSLGMPEEAFQHQRGLITKSEVRAAILAGLELRPGHTLWDLGAGCGSVGLEAGLLLSGGRVIALEMSPERVADIKANRRLYGASWLEVIQGRAPRALGALPDPDRVFIGGAGTDLEAVALAAAGRLPAGGVLLAAVVRLDSLHQAQEAFAAAGLTVGVSQVSVCRGAPLSGSLQLKPLNPVWLVKGGKA